VAVSPFFATFNPAQEFDLPGSPLPIIKKRDFSPQQGVLNYFNGGTIYEIPAGQDRFELEVTPPFGKENIVLYASTKPLGELETTPASGVFEVKTKPAEIGLVTRGVKIKATSADDPKTQTAEFAEATADLVTSR